MVLTGKCTGEVRLPGAHIAGFLYCGASFTNPHGDALTADWLIVDGSMALMGECTGEVRLPGAHIGGELDCSGAHFTNPHGRALTADLLTVDVSMFLAAKCTGEVRLPGARIAGQLHCTGASFINTGGCAVDLELARVTQNVLMRPDVLEGGLKLTNARVGGWYDQQKTWPSADRLMLEGFVYDRISPSDGGVEARLRFWLPQTSYLAQPYTQLAEVYRREGNEQDARRVAIAKQRARRADVNKWWRRWPSQAWSFILRWTIGYGHQPVLALIPLAVLVLAGTGLFHIAHPSHLHPAKTAPEQPGFNPFRYTVDLLLPVATFMQRDYFVAEGWAA